MPEGVSSSTTNNPIEPMKGWRIMTSQRERSRITIGITTGRMETWGLGNRKIPRKRQNLKKRPLPCTRRS